MNRTPSAPGTAGTLDTTGATSATSTSGSPRETGTLRPPLPAADPRPRFLDLVASEWVKLRSLRSTWIAYGTAALAVLAFNGGTAYDTATYWTEEDAAHRADFIRDGIPLQLAFTGNAAMVMMLALGALGALAIVGEYSTGTIRTTFAAVPARGAVMGAKAVVVAAFAALFGALVAGGSFFLTQAILDGKGLGVPLGHPGAGRVILASALLAPVCALAGMALGTVVRHTAATMITTVGVLLVLPIVLTDGRHWSATAGHALPYRAWLRLVDVRSLPADFPWTTGGAWTVYVVWTLAAAAVAVVGVRRRDV
ncbi:ABC transporter permease subunit [Streptomyces venezuelae]|uniref:ABC transporter permease subunit n=1 Tax=Streptomyces venezuelae TaxID=54571 RepID=UPI00278C739F|nr:ABC transporter permease subunit [Streptomyces venezuelae]